MQLWKNKKEKDVIDKITQRFGNDYSMDFRIGEISIYINSKLSRLKLNIDYFQVNGTNSLVVYTGDDDACYMKYHEDKTDYLDMINDILNNLSNQLNIYKDFIIGFTQHLSDNGYEYLMDMVGAKLYINLHNNKVVIEPKLNMSNTENYATMHVNSIYGKYPLEKYTSISFDDLQDDINFFISW